jgi:hypothetical protein
MTDAGRSEEISGLDDLTYAVTLTDRTGAPITTGSVTMSLCSFGTVTPLGGLAAASQVLTHAGSGVWTGTHDLTNVAAAIASIPVGALFVRCLTVTGIATRQLATCRRVRVVVGNGAGAYTC